ncbi:MAG: hypothetical protein RL302_1401 [Pseudomonadota bacterium]|jgi:hypothetical protein
MHNSPINQAAGLMGINRSQRPRLTAFVSHGDAASELPLLWKLCAAMVDLGYSVTVLDGTAPETGHNPGLEQVLDYSVSHDAASDTPAWRILPAMQGLNLFNTFASPAAQCLNSLGRAFPHDSVIVMYSNAQVLSTLLSHTGVTPLLSISNAKTSLITSYLALKRLLLKGRVQPILANVVQYTEDPHEKRGSVASNLRDCAKYFLDFDVNILTIIAPPGEDRPGTDVQRLALTLIEGAIPLDTGWTASSMRSHAVPAGRDARSH